MEELHFATTAQTAKQPVTAGFVTTALVYEFKRATESPYDCVQRF